MNDLISRSALLEELNNYHYDTVNSVTRRVEHIVNAHFIELIEKRPVAFDVDKVMKELEKEKDEYTAGGVVDTTAFVAGIEFGLEKAMSIISKQKHLAMETHKSDPQGHDEDENREENEDMARD